MPSKINWKKENEILSNFLKNMPIPSADLEDVNFINLKSKADLKKIPGLNGCYWITTNAPITHTFHNKRLPAKINDYNIIYNGIAKNISQRIANHLFRETRKKQWSGAGMSGISIDIHMEPLYKSHAKHVFGPPKKTPYINGKQIKNYSL